MIIKTHIHVHAYPFSALSQAKSPVFKGLGWVWKHQYLALVSIYVAFETYSTFSLVVFGYYSRNSSHVSGGHVGTVHLISFDTLLHGFYPWYIKEKTKTHLSQYIIYLLAWAQMMIKHLVLTLHVWQSTINPPTAVQHTWEGIEPMKGRASQIRRLRYLSWLRRRRWVSGWIVFFQYHGIYIGREKAGTFGLLTGDHLEYLYICEEWRLLSSSVCMYTELIPYFSVRMLYC